MKAKKLSEFQSYFLKIFTGTIIAQVIGIAASPILTRLYAPEQYGDYGLYLSILTILTVFSTLRFEYAINTAKDDSEVVTIISLIRKIGFFCSLIVLVVLIISPWRFDNLFILFLFFSVFLTAQNQSYQYLNNRNKNFNILSKTKIFQIITSTVIAILLSFIISDYGLIIGNFIALLVVNYLLLKPNLKFLIETEKTNENQIFRKYKDFALFNTPSALFDVISLQSPIFFIKFFIGTSYAGFYSLTMRTILLPLNLISVSLSQVYLSKISEKFRNKEPFHYITKKIIVLLAITGTVPVILLLFFSEILFSFVFGEQWVTSGEIASIMAISLFFRFIASPLSNIFFITNTLKHLLVLQSIRMVTTLVTLYISSHSYSLYTLIWCYTIHDSIYYIIYIFLILYVSKTRGEKIEHI